MAADALAVVGVHITAEGRLVALDLEYGGLRAVHHAVVAFEAQTAAHAAFGFRHNLLPIPSPRVIFLKLYQPEFGIYQPSLSLST